MLMFKVLFRDGHDKNARKSEKSNANYYTAYHKKKTKNIG